jgi:Protein of unknown function (DUF2550)
MAIFEFIGAGVVAVLVALLVIFVRREVISHNGGTIDMNIRLSTFAAERGWAPGLGRFVGDELRWYRVFSFSARPRRVMTRSSLEVLQRRAPEGAERLTLPDAWVVLRCRGGGIIVELALAQSALNGFLSWLESGLPGGHPMR